MHTHQGREPGERFDEHRTGLDHVGFAVGSLAELERWAQKLTDLGIAHDGINKAHYGSGAGTRLRTIANTVRSGSTAPGTNRRSRVGSLPPREPVAPGYCRWSDVSAPTIRNARSA